MRRKPRTQQQALIFRVAQFLERRRGLPVKPRDQTIDYATIEDLDVSRMPPFVEIRRYLVQNGYGRPWHFKTVGDVLGFFGYSDIQLWFVAVDLSFARSWHDFAKEFRKLARLEPKSIHFVGC